MEFRIGDRVKYIGKKVTNRSEKPNEKEDLDWGLLGTVTEVPNNCHYNVRVQFDNHKENFTWLVNDRDIFKYFEK